MVLSQRSYLWVSLSQVKQQEVAAGVTDPISPLPSVSDAPNFQLFLPSCCCAWPAPTFLLTLTSEPSYKYALSILVTFLKKCSQVINTPAICLPSPPYHQPGWGLGVATGLRVGKEVEGA